MQLAKKAICFRWQSIHYALPVGDWLRRHQQYACGLHCGAPTKSILHVFWLCPKIKQFWSKLFLLLRQHHSRSIFSWGAVLWDVLYGDIIRYESTHVSHVFHFSHGHLYLTSFPSSITLFRIEILVIWRTIMSLVLWIIWEVRCDNIFNTEHIHLCTMLIEFWLLLPYTTWSILGSTGFN